MGSTHPGAATKMVIPFKGPLQLADVAILRSPNSQGNAGLLGAVRNMFRADKSWQPALLMLWVHALWDIVLTVASALLVLL